MVLVVQLMGIIIVVVGTIFALHPAGARTYIDFWKHRRRLRLVGVIRILVGIAFLLAAGQCRSTAVIMTIGILIILKGIMVYVIGPDRAKSFLQYLEDKPPLTMRILSLLALGVGILILYSI